MAKLRQYAGYEPSGLKWLEQIPRHWGVLRTKYLFREVDERSRSGEEVHLSMSQTHGLIESERIEQRRLQSETYVGGKLCKRGDLVLNRLKAHLGVFAHAPQDGVVSPDYTVFRLRGPGNVRYFEALFRTPEFVAELRRSTKGIVEGFWRLYTDDFYNIHVVVPPEPEQEQIVRFIAAKDRLVRRFVRSKRRLVDLLNNQKQAVIHRAVTNGTSPDLEAKSSGRGWLGDVPAHWRIRRLKDLTGFENGIAFKPSGWRATGVPIIRIQNLNGSDIFNYTDREDLPSNLLIQPGELLFSWSGNRGTSFGPFVWDRAFPAYLNQHIFRLSGYDLNKQFFYYLLRAVTRIVEEQTHGIIGLVHITKPELGAISVAVPPPSEQRAIGEHLDKACADVDAAIGRARREMELIREYRGRLVADVVTGRLDVRAAAVSVGCPLEPDAAANEPDEFWEELPRRDGIAEGVAVGDE